MEYPENIVRAIGIPLVCGNDVYAPLTADQVDELESKIDSLASDGNNRYREALLLHYRDGLTYQSIAEVMGFISLGSAYGVVKTAVGRIRRLYEGKRPRRAPPTDQTCVGNAHEMALVKNDRVVEIDADGKAWYEGFAAPTAVEFFHAVPAETPVDNEMPTPVDKKITAGGTME